MLRSIRCDIFVFLILDDWVNANRMVGLYSNHFVIGNARVCVFFRLRYLYTFFFIWFNDRMGIFKPSSNDLLVRRCVINGTNNFQYFRRDIVGLQYGFCPIFVEVLFFMVVIHLNEGTYRTRA